MVSLKSLVSGISILLFFSSSVVGPQGSGSVYIVLLAFLSPAAEQNYKALTVPAKIDSISRAEVDALFLNAALLYYQAGGRLLSSSGRMAITVNKKRSFKMFKPFSPPDRVRGPLKSFNGARTTSKVPRLLNCAAFAGRPSGFKNSSLKNFTRRNRSHFILFLFANRGGKFS
jgi:hypothetical protein